MKLLLLLQLVALIAVNLQLKKLTMTIQELGTEISNVAAQLQKALDEIILALQNAGNVPQDVIDKLNAAKAVAQQLDDLNPDNP
jgi:CII-binding regulator of phage lambda lysogenization HflD